jgi:benzylsuccinate CoA-transferase BbsF subunit
LVTPEDGSLPLSGIRVVEVGYAMAGPLTARYLGHFGADVVRIESRRKPDSLRVSRASWLPAEVGFDIARDTSPLLNLSSAEKRSIVLEIDQPDGYAAFSRIVATADVLITNLSADAIPKLRLTYDDIKAIRPDVIYLASTAFGDQGPYRSFRTWGMNLCAISGLDAMLGWPDRDPSGMGMSFPDYPTALIAVSAIVAALQRRRATGAGAHLELPQFNVGLNCVGTSIADAALGGLGYQARGNRDVSAVPQGVYPARGEDRWVAISVTGDSMWAALCRVDGLQGLGADRRFGTTAGRTEHHDELDDALSAWTRSRTDWEAASELQDAGVAAAPVSDCWDALGDPHLASRDFFQLAASRRFGADLVCRPASASADGPAARVRRAAPAMGEHSREILRDVAGLDEPAIDQLMSDRISEEMAQPGTQLRRPYLGWIGRLLRLRWPSA